MRSRNLLWIMCLSALPGLGGLPIAHALPPLIQVDVTGGGGQYAMSLSAPALVAQDGLVSLTVTLGDTGLPTPIDINQDTISLTLWEVDQAIEPAAEPDDEIISVIIPYTADMDFLVPLSYHQALNVPGEAEDGAGAMVELQAVAVFNKLAGPATLSTADTSLLALQVLDDDPYEDNDDLASATPLALDSPLNDLVARDGDFFVFTQPHRLGSVTVDLAFVHGQANLDMILRDTTGTEIARADSLDDNEHLSLPLPMGNYIVEVTTSGPNIYDLAVTSQCTPDCAGRDCGDDGCGGSCGGTCFIGEVCQADGTCRCSNAGEYCPDWNGCCGDSQSSDCIQEYITNTYFCTGECRDDGDCDFMGHGSCCERVGGFPPLWVCLPSWCPDHPECGLDLCGHFCGCPEGEICSNDVCVPGECSEPMEPCPTFGECCGMGETADCLMDMGTGLTFCSSYCAIDEDCQADYPNGCCEALDGIDSMLCLPSVYCCHPNCEFRDCGDDGCGGSCGTCPDELSCHDNLCVEPVPGDVCFNAIQVQAAQGIQNFSFNTWDAGRDYEGSCGGATGPEVVLQINVPNRMSMTALASGIDTVMYLRQICDDPASQLDCNDNIAVGDPRSRIVIELPAGTYFLFADARGNTGGTIQVAFSFTCISDCTGRQCGDDGCGGSCGTCGPDLICMDGICDKPPDGYTCAAPIDLTVVMGQTMEIPGDTTDALANYSGACRVNVSPDVVYAFTLDHIAQMDALVSGFDTVLYLRTSCADPLTEIGCNDDSTPPGSRGSRLNMTLNPGVYFLHVDGFNAQGPYNMSLTFTCIPQCEGLACGDDTCGGVCGTCGPGTHCDHHQCVSCGEALGECLSDGDCCGTAMATMCDLSRGTPGFCTAACLDAQDCSGPFSGGCCREEGAHGPLCLTPAQCCIPDCTGRECGDDGCGGTCGSCDGLYVCDAGSCILGCQVAGEPCVNGVEDCCGEDTSSVCFQPSAGEPFCSGLCANDGDCAYLGGCCERDAGGTWACVPPQLCCEPMCDGLECGGDGCGGVCGNCPDGWSCDNGLCLAPCQGTGGPCLNGISDCCGDDTSDVCFQPSEGVPFCSGLCANDGDCAYLGGCCERDTGGTWACVPPQLCCESMCDGRQCGDDGCGGVCGTCPDGWSCDNGLCLAPCQGTGGPCLNGISDCCGDDTSDVCFQPSEGVPFCTGLCEQDLDCAYLEGGCCELNPGGEWACVPPELCCEPMCDGLECGDDGCGGVCGSCPDGWSCEAGLCLEPCHGAGAPCLGGAGECCGGPDSSVCFQPETGAPFCTGPCEQDIECAYFTGGCCERDQTHIWACVPSGLCCEPQCDGLECGDDGCGGSCGACPQGWSCDNGLCSAPCRNAGEPCLNGISDCCGEATSDVCFQPTDGTDPFCTGPCSGDGECAYLNDGCCERDQGGEWACVPPELCCEPLCDGRECGDDGCGGVCGQCLEGWDCVGGACIPPCHGPGELCPGGVADCCGEGDSSVCFVPEDGPAFCTGPCTLDSQCGYLDGGCCERDQQGNLACVPEVLCCDPLCDDRQCGDDGCGGSCGTCPDGWACEEGQCNRPCSDAGEACLNGVSDCCGNFDSSTCFQPNDGSDPFCTGLCSGDGECAYLNDGCCELSLGGEWACVPLELCCEPMCDGLECGDDGCGGSCGDCPDGWACLEGLCNEPCHQAGEPCPNGISDCCTEAASSICLNREGGEPFCTGGCLQDLDCSHLAGGCCEPLAPGGDMVCVPNELCCQPRCGGRQCGDDGCGGVCGECLATEWCFGGLCLAQTAGDLCEDAIELDPGEGTIVVPGTTAPMADDLDSSCRPTSGADVFYQFTVEAPTDMVAMVRGFDTVLILLDGCEGTELQCNDDSTPPGNFGSRVETTLEPGTYILVVDSASAPGSYELEVTFVCYPACEGRECGDDGCGGSCGVCDGGYECVDGSCRVEGCSGPGAGCPNHDECCNEADSSQCVFDSLASAWFCTGTCEGDGDCAYFGGGCCLDVGGPVKFCMPQKYCCQPACDGLVCGDDGCGGSCGTCRGNTECQAGQCVQTCSDMGQGCTDAADCCPFAAEPLCVEGTCTASCASNSDCSALPGGCCGDQNLCLTAEHCCQPDCDGRVCGDDGCGGLCGQCDEGTACQDGLCEALCADGGDPCLVDEDCCGGVCHLGEGGEPFCTGPCASDGDCSYLNGGCCQEVEDRGAICLEAELCCVPLCDGRECGDDGCGGTCGHCDTGWSCREGICEEGCAQGGDPCQGDGDCCSDQDSKFCQGTYCTGPCEVDQDCSYLEGGCCREVEGRGSLCLNGSDCCAPDCEGRECGDDGCGGLCGECDEGASCDNGACVALCVDLDDDGYGEGCEAGEDCQDDDDSVYPGAEEICDGRDNDCDGEVDEGCGDDDCVCNQGPLCDDACPCDPDCASPKAASGCGCVMEPTAGDPGSGLIWLLALALCGAWRMRRRGQKRSP